MEAYARTKCETHGVTDCVLCAMKARKDKSAPVQQPAYQDHTAAPGAPPPDLEGLSTPRAVETDWAATGAHDAACNKTEDPTVTKRYVEGTTIPWPKDFSTLPVDDSQPSKVLRAAAAYAKAAAEYGLALSRLESLKTQLKLTELAFDNAREARDKAEQELKHLTNEVIYPFKDVDDAAKKRMEAALKAAGKEA